MEDDSLLTCEVCNNPVKEEDDFCPECGALFIDDVFCSNHNSVPAEGVCIICSIPFCEECGTDINNQFLCNDHNGYETYEGMAKVYDTLDETDALYAKDSLELNGLHPVLLYRHSLYGGSGFSKGVFSGSGNIKVRVPFQEVLRAEEVIKSISAGSEGS